MTNSKTTKGININGEVIQMTVEQVINRCMPLCIKVAKEFRISGYDFDDNKQVCLIALCKAYESYNREDVRFISYAENVMRNKMICLIREQNTVKRSSMNTALSLDVEISTSENNQTFSEIVADESVNIEEEICNKELVKIIMENVTEKEMELIPVMMGLKKNSDLARELGVSSEAVRKRMNKLKFKLAELLNGIGYNR